MRYTTDELLEIRRLENLIRDSDHDENVSFISRISTISTIIIIL